MITLNRWTMGIPALVFAAFQAFLGLSALSVYQSKTPVLIGMGAYLLCCVLSIVPYPSIRIPRQQATLNLIVAAALPLLVNSVLDHRHGFLHDTWYVEAVATLLAITAVRGHIPLAFLGLVVLWVEVIAWGGASTIFTAGLVGSLLLVFAGTAASIGFTRLNSEIDSKEASELETQRQTVALQIAGDERARLLKESLRGAKPFLDQIAAGKPIKDKEKLLDVAESVRDGLAGRQLVDDTVQSAVRKARKRGVEVVFVVENELDDCSAEQLTSYRRHISSELGRIKKGRVIIRSISYGSLRVRFMVTQPGDPRPVRAIRF